MWESLFSLQWATEQCIWAAPSKKSVFEYSQKCTHSDSFHACSQFHPGICSPLTHYLMSNDSISGQRRLWSECVEADLGLRCSHMPEDTFSHGAAHFIITKTYLYNVDPLKPYFYKVKLGFTGVYIIFLFLLKNIECGYSLEPPRWGGSNEYPQSMFWAEVWKIPEFFIWKCSFFGGEIFSIF